MKICIISGLYEPNIIGGAEIVAAQSAKTFASDGHEVIVITSGLYFGLSSLKVAEKYDAENGIRIFSFYPINIAHYTNMLRRPFWFRVVWHLLDMVNVHSFFAIRKIIRQERPDEVYTHGIKGLGYTVWAALRSCGVPIIHRIHDIQLVEPTGLLMAGEEEKINNAFHRLYIAVCRWFVGNPQTIESPSKWALDMHRAKGFFEHSETRIVSNPLPELMPVTKEKSKEDNPRLLYVGQIEGHKGIKFLVKALMEKMQTPFLLQIVGDGSQLDQIRQIVSRDERFSIRGRLEGKDLAKAFAWADMLIVPSTCHENSPTVISIANSLGLPVIASNVGGIPEMVPENNLFPPEDAGALVDLIKTRFISIID